MKTCQLYLAQVMPSNEVDWVILAGNWLLPKWHSIWFWVLNWTYINKIDAFQRFSKFDFLGSSSCYALTNPFFWYDGDHNSGFKFTSAWSILNLQLFYNSSACQPPIRCMDGEGVDIVIFGKAIAGCYWALQRWGYICNIQNESLETSLKTK